MATHEGKTQDFATGIASETAIKPQTLNEYVRIARKNIVGDGGLGSLQLSEIDVPTISEFLTALLHGTDSTPPRPSIAKQARVVLTKMHCAAA